MLKRNLIYPALLLAAITTSAETATWTVGSNSWPVEITTKDLCPGVKYTLVDWKTNRSSSYPGSHLHVIEADLTNQKISVENVKPDAMTGVRNLTNHAKAVHKSNHQVVAGANGNFWITSPEAGNYACMGTQPHGVCVSNGVMYTDPNVGSFAHCGGPSAYTGLLAFDENGKAYLDYTAAQKANNAEGSGVQFAVVNTSYNNQRIALDMCNRWVAANSASIFTRQYGTSKTFRVGDLSGSTWTETKGTGHYAELILDYADGTSAMNYGATTDYVIKEVRYDPASIGTLGNHDLAIVARNTVASKLAKWKVGDRLTLDTKINFVSMGSPEKIANAISGNVLAMKNGVITNGTTTEAYNTSYNARTVYGINADGTKLWIFTCEHNAAKSKKLFGFSLEQICIMARDYFGVTHATQVDCGGSAQMFANGAQVAQSYDASGVRSVYNGLFVIYNGNDVTLPAPGANTPEPTEPDPDEGWTDSGVRAHYAYDLTTIAGTDAPTVSYKLTGAVKSAEIVLTNRNDANDVVTIDANTTEGFNSVAITDSRLTPGATYDWAVKVNSFAVPATSHFFHEAPAKLDARGGVGIVTNPDSPAFGRIISSTGYAQGFGLYNQDLTKVGTYHAGMSPWVADNRSSTYRIAMRDRSVAYACDLSDKGAGYWRFDPENPTAAPENLIGGVNDGTGCFKMPGSSTCVGSGATGIGFQGTGNNTKLWVFAEDWPSGNAATKIILTRWDIGSADKITTAVSSSYPQYTGQKTFANQNGSITPATNGIFAAQHRSKGNNTTSVPGFIYTDVDGTLLYNSGSHTDLFQSCAGSVAISDDQSLFAVSGYNENIKIFRVAWNGNVPSFTLLATVNGTGKCNAVSQMAFDPAGNLFAWQHTNNAETAGLFGYSYKNDNPTATTPARATYAIVAVDPAGIDAITVDNDVTPTYYNIQGIRVDASDLTPGIYIKKTGTKSEKIIIR